MGKKWLALLCACAVLLTFQASAAQPLSAPGTDAGAVEEQPGGEAAGTTDGGSEDTTGGATDGWSSTTYMDASVVKADVEGSHPSDVLIEGDRLVCESDTLRLYYNESTSILKVEDRRNGYLWSSGQQNEATESLSARWQGFSHALASAEFITRSTMTTSELNPDFDSQQTTYLDNGFEVRLTFQRAKLSLLLRFTLEDDKLTVEVPDEEIVGEDEGIVLSKLYVLPFFGATMANQGAGYLFVPDGSGALIRFGASMTGTGQYTGHIYGNDVSITGIGAGNVSTNKVPKPDRESVRLPVFGTVHGSRQNAVLYQVTQGAEYCDIVANPAGNVIDWYWIAPHFIYNEMYNQQDNTNSGFLMVQGEQNVVNASFTMTFLAQEEASYVGMAKAYRQELIDAGVLSPSGTKSGDIPLLLDCLMGESESNGLLTTGVVLTELTDLSRWQEVLSGAGIHNILYSLRGASKGGYSREDLDDFSLWGKVGSKSELEELQSLGMQLVWRKDLMTAFDGQVSNNELAYAINRVFAYDDYYGYLDEEIHFANLETVADIVQAAGEDGLLSSLAVSSLPNLLIANYKSGSSYSRLQARDTVVSLLDALQNQQDSLLLQAPNAYAFPFASAAYDLPANHSYLLYETDAVPFLQIVLGGSVDLYARSDTVLRAGNASVLKLIDFNLYPQFTVTEASSSALTKTNSLTQFATHFDSLSDDIVAIYQTVNAVLAPVSGALLTDRQVVRDNVAVSTYDNGWSVVVNYSAETYTQGSVSVPAQSAVSVQTSQLGEGGDAA